MKIKRFENIDFDENNWDYEEEDDSSKKVKLDKDKMVDDIMNMIYNDPSGYEDFVYGIVENTLRDYDTEDLKDILQYEDDEICDECDGEGYIDGKKCEICNGTGNVDIYEYKYGKK